MSTSHTPARRRPRRFLATAALAFAFASTALPREAAAATAKVTWLPPRGGTVVSYGIYVRNAGAAYGSSPIWTGNPAPAADGSISTTLTYTAASSGVNYFAVVSRDSTTESVISAELPIGTPNRCRNDRCVTKTSCDFSNVPNGTSCADASFCNGAETCQSGTCTAGTPPSCADALACTVDSCDEASAQCKHVSPPGCCVACDSDDPCLADACAQGDCAAPGGADIEVNRLKLVNKASGITLAAKGKFEADPGIDPSVTGVVFELHGADGTLLYSSWIDGDSIRAGATGNRYRFAVSRQEADALSHGLTRLDFRIKGSSWLVSAKAETMLLQDALAEPTLTWMVRFGSDGCARRMNMDCTQRPSKSICR